MIAPEDVPMIRRIVRGLALVLVAAPALAQTTPPAAGASARQALPVLVDVEWLAQHLNDPKVVIMHRGRDYAARHIPGARDLGQGEVTVARLASLGVSDDSHVVLYTTGAEIPAPLMFALDEMGLADRFSLLNGGLVAWTSAGRPVTSEVPRIVPGTLRTPAARSLVVDAEFVKSIGQRPNHKLVDARAPVFYQGIEGMHGKAGHIPGAVNIPHGDVESGVLDREKLARMFSAAGINPGDTVVAYCHVGQYARWVIFAARVLGHPVRLYGGSFHDWTMNDRGPVVK
jgi:thiosulfate/3-mercaptopyruvate sulfurtransferase